MGLPEARDAGTKRIVGVKNLRINDVIELRQSTGRTPRHRQWSGEFWRGIYDGRPQCIGGGLGAEVEIWFQVIEATGPTDDVDFNTRAAYRAS